MKGGLPRLLVLAGSDPTGGAGVDADREAALAAGVEAICFVTAQTDQDGFHVARIGPRDPEVWLSEARAFLSSKAEARPCVLKSGLLPGAEHIRALIELALQTSDLPLVVDPVLSASGGEVFLDEPGISALKDELLPLGPILTPNLPEAARLIGVTVEALEPLDARIEAATLLIELGAKAVLLKGGHGREDPVRDLVLERGRDPAWHTHARVKGAVIHGSGCRYAASLAAGLALGESLGQAAERAGRYLAHLLSKRPFEDANPDSQQEPPR